MTKETMKIVIIGHVDHGKSTLIGRLLLDTNSLPKDKITEIRKISRELGKDTELAYLTDQLKEERAHNITIDTTQIFFKTRKRNYVIIDVPGHVEFLKNMITGASLAEAAVLIVDVHEGIMEQTKRQAFIINMLGIDKVLIVFNKMDLIDYEKDRFNEVKNELLRFLKDVGIKSFYIIPTSAREGVNISGAFSKLSWYKGPTLLQALDLFKKDAKSVKKPLRIPLQDVYEIRGEKIIVGRVASGTVRQGEKITIFPSLKSSTIKSIERFGRHTTSACEGENIGLALKDSLPARRGEIITQHENPPQPINRFKGNVFWMSDEPLQIDKTITLRCATQEVECVAEKIEQRINSSTLEVIEEKADKLGLNEVGVVTFRSEKPILVEDFSFIEELGRFVVEHNYNVQGAGIITT